MRTLVVGDVHGCLDELDALLREASLRPGDALVLVGDLVAKGPESRGVVRRAMELRARSVRGNHDQRVLDVVARRAAGEKLPPSPHLDVARRLKEPELDWLAALPFTLDLEALQAIVVHGGLVPGVALEAQDPAVMMTMRSLREDGTPSKRIGDGVPWASRWPGPAEAIFGHDAVRGLQRHPHATGLDTGCVYGGRLTGYLLPERELVSVPAAMAYAAAG